MTRTAKASLLLLMLVGATILTMFVVAPRKTNSKVRSFLHLLFRNEGSPYPQGAAVGAADCNSVDGEKLHDEKKFLECTRNAITAAKKALLTSSNVDEAVKNVNTCGGSGVRNVMLVGHGAQGLIHTGGGSIEAERKQYIADVQRSSGLFNPQLWTDKVKEWDGKVDTITLFACDAGADTDGARLMKELANRTHATIRASTFTVWCQDGKMWLDQHAHWKTVKPSSEVVIDKKPVLYTERAGFVQLLKIGKTGKEGTGNFDELRQAEIKSINVCVSASTFHEGQPCKRMDQIEILLNSIDFQNPFQTRAVPAAEVTGSFEIVLKPDGAGKVGRASIRFDVFNDELILDDNTHTYYHTSETFQKRWTQF